MSLDEFEEKVREIAGDAFYWVGREEERERGKKTVTWRAYTRRAGIVGRSNDAYGVLAELAEKHRAGVEVQHVA
jgi:hypothetical protein